MEIFTDVSLALLKYPDSVIVHDIMGDCMICGEHKDLRCGACFNCCDKVSGAPIKNGHKLWETENPDNTWYIGKMKHE